MTTAEKRSEPGAVATGSVADYVESQRPIDPVATTTPAPLPRGGHRSAPGSDFIARVGSLYSGSGGVYKSMVELRRGE